MRGHANPRLRAKAERYGRDARACLKIIDASRRYVCEERRGWLEGLKARLIRETGPMTITERIQGRLAPALLLKESLKQLLRVGQQPEFTRRTYRSPDDLPALVRGGGRAPAPRPVVDPALVAAAAAASVALAK